MTSGGRRLLEGPALLSESDFQGAVNFLLDSSSDWVRDAVKKLEAHDEARVERERQLLALLAESWGDYHSRHGQGVHGGRVTDSYGFKESCKFERCPEFRAVLRDALRDGQIAFNPYRFSQAPRFWTD